MATNNSAERVRAILDIVRPGDEPAVEVRARDFSTPRRLSSAQIATLSRAARRVLPQIEAHIAHWLRSAHVVEIRSVVESDAQSVIDALVEPFSALAFDVAGETGLVVWEAGAMVAAIETALGATDVQAARPRALSSVETRILVALLAHMAELVSSALGVSANHFRVVTDAGELARADESLSADAPRVAVHIALDGAAGPSTLRIHVPGVTPPAPADALREPMSANLGSLPARLAGVEIELRAEIGAAQVSVQDLLMLEVGSVLRLSTKAGALVLVRAEGEPCARAELGEHEGRLALRIHSLEPRTPTRGRA